MERDHQVQHSAALRGIEASLDERKIKKKTHQTRAREVAPRKKTAKVKGAGRSQDV